LGAKVNQTNAAGDYVRGILLDVNNEMLKKLGKPPVGKKWIYSKRRTGAHLNTAKITWIAGRKLKKFLRLQEKCEINRQPKSGKKYAQQRGQTPGSCSA